MGDLQDPIDGAMLVPYKVGHILWGYSLTRPYIYRPYIWNRYLWHPMAMASKPSDSHGFNLEVH